jgi:glycosyltransferase involved in cell wall biosynthesis
MNTSPKSVLPDAEPAMRLAFLYMKGRMVRLADVERGAAPTEFFYGAIELARLGHEIAHFEIDPDAVPGLAERALGRLLPGFVRPVKMSAAIVVQAFRFAKELNQADCLVATGGNIAFALAALASVGIIRKPIIGIQCGVLNFRHGFARRTVSRTLLRRMHTLLFGEAELEPMQRFFDLPPTAISVNLFGVDTRFWRPDPQTKRDIVLAIGNDGRRDFSTLIHAAAGIPAPIHIVTKLPLPSPLPDNVMHHRGSWHGTELSDKRIRDLYQRARVVVVPLHSSNQPSGQSVTLQAMACRCPVVLTETAGLWSRAQMIDGENVRFVRPGDHAQLAEQVSLLLNDATTADRLAGAGRAMVERVGNIEAFAAGVARCCRGRLDAAEKCVS